MKKIFTLFAVAAFCAGAAHASTTVKAEVKTWLTPTTYVSYVGDLEIQDDDNGMFTLPKGLGNSDYGLYFRKVQDSNDADQIEIWGSAVTNSGYAEDDWVGDDGTCYTGLDEANVLFIYDCGAYIYNDIAGDNMSGYITMAYDVYDYDAWESTVESWATTTTISWPAKEVENTFEGATYTNGRTGETYNVNVVKSVGGLFRVPAFQGNDGYDLTFDENGVWSAISEMCFNPALYEGSDYYITVPLALPVSYTLVGQKDMIVTSAEADIENGKLTITYLYSEDGDDPSEDVYTDTLVWGAAGVNTVEADQTSQAPETLYNLQGIQVSRENAAPGLYISRCGDKSQKVIIR